ncbi:unnamed protein product, partial [Ectocarpus sp. 12 AP-2014]
AKQRRKRTNRKQQRGESEDDIATDTTVTRWTCPLLLMTLTDTITCVYRRRAPCACRMNFLTPGSGDIWYLRLLLHHIPASNWTDFRLYNRQVHASHQSVARARGLVADSQEYDLTFMEAIDFSTPRGLRCLLVTLII